MPVWVVSLSLDWWNNVFDSKWINDDRGVAILLGQEHLGDVVVLVLCYVILINHNWVNDSIRMRECT